MNDLIEFVAEEATEQAKALPGEVVAVVAFIFSADGTVAPVVGGLPEGLPVVAQRLVDVAAGVAADLTGTRREAHQEPNGLSSGTPAGFNRAAGRGAALTAERLATDAIRRARGR